MLILNLLCAMNTDEKAVLNKISPDRFASAGAALRFEEEKTIIDKKTESSIENIELKPTRDAQYIRLTIDMRDLEDQSGLIEDPEGYKNAFKQRLTSLIKEIILRDLSERKLGLSVDTNRKSTARGGTHLYETALDEMRFSKE